MVATICRLVFWLVVETRPAALRNLVLVCAMHPGWFSANGARRIHRIRLDDSATAQDASCGFCICRVCSDERRTAGDLGGRRRKGHRLDRLACGRTPKRSLGSGRFTDSALGGARFGCGGGFSRQPAHVHCSRSAGRSCTDRHHLFRAAGKAAAVWAVGLGRAVHPCEMATPSHSHLAGCTTFETCHSAVYRLASLGRQAFSSERHIWRKMTR